jgi:hypothetical protein
MTDDYIQEFYEYWRCGHCPKCESLNWIYDSHSQRHYPDIRDGCKCFKCGHKFFLGEKDEFDIRYGGELEDHTVEQVLEEYFDYYDGREDPNWRKSC